MENRKEEFLKIVCQIYLIAVLAVLPLYYIPWNGYYKLGDTKYYLYRNISLCCLGICLYTPSLPQHIHAAVPAGHIPISEAVRSG